VRPLDLFCYVEKQHISSTKTNLVKNCTYFFSKGIKRTNFFPASPIYYLKISFFNSEARVANFFTNLARDQKSLAPPVIYERRNPVQNLDSHFSIGNLNTTIWDTKGSSLKKFQSDAILCEKGWSTNWKLGKSWLFFKNNFLNKKNF